jgi:hypothetical protein
MDLALWAIREELASLRVAHERSQSRIEALASSMKGTELPGDSQPEIVEVRGCRSPAYFALSQPVTKDPLLVLQLQRSHALLAEVQKRCSRIIGRGRREVGVTFRDSEEYRRRKIQRFMGGTDDMPFKVRGRLDRELFGSARTGVVRHRAYFDESSSDSDD